MRFISKPAFRFCFISLYLFFISNKSIAQQQPQYSQYMFNRFAINPASAGNADDVQAISLVRRQWSGASGTPCIQSLAIHSPFFHKSMGVGVQLYHETLAFQKNRGILIGYAYKIRVARGILSGGIGAGIKTYSLDASGMHPKDPDDEYLPYGNSGLVPDLNTGVYFQNKKLYAGVSVSPVIATRVHYNEQGVLQRSIHAYFLAGYVYSFSDRMRLLPSVLIKYTNGAPVQAGSTFLLEYNKAVWLGLSASTAAIGFQTGLSLHELSPVLSSKIKIGYAYEANIFGLAPYKSGTHEFMLIYDFTLERSPEKIEDRKPYESPLFN